MSKSNVELIDKKKKKNNRIISTMLSISTSTCDQIFTKSKNYTPRS